MACYGEQVRRGVVISCPWCSEAGFGVSQQANEEEEVVL